MTIAPLSLQIPQLSNQSFNRNQFEPNLKSKFWLLSLKIPST